MSTSAMPIGACVNAFSKALRMGTLRRGLPNLFMAW
jgi:hypothetical protein